MKPPRKVHFYLRLRVYIGARTRARAHSLRLQPRAPPVRLPVTYHDTKAGGVLHAHAGGLGGRVCVRARARARARVCVRTCVRVKQYWSNKSGRTKGREAIKQNSSLRVAEPKRSNDNGQMIMVKQRVVKLALRRYTKRRKSSPAPQRTSSAGSSESAPSLRRIG